MTIQEQALELPKLEKLKLMEALWSNLSEDESEVESPAWHGELLKTRDKALAAGEDAFIPWEQAKRELRQRHSQ